MAPVSPFPLLRVVWLNTREMVPDRQVIRIAHYLLETGHREAMDALIDAYESVHPSVTVIQIDVPQRVWVSWIRTQLVGGQGPDLVQSEQVNLNDEILSRYFTSLTEEVAKPNPYNIGTDLESTPWRDTFLDGLSNRPNYSNTLAEVYGIPTHVSAGRMFVNMDLYRRTTGWETLPKDYGDFLEVCEAIDAFRTSTDSDVVPVAASREDMGILNNYFTIMTRKLQDQIDVELQIYPWGMQIPIDFLNGAWGFDSPEIHAGYSIMRDVGRYFPPGFLQLTRDDALFYFVQGQAAFYASGSSNYLSIRSQIRFDFDIFHLPTPTTDHPQYGRFVYGKIADSDVSAWTGFALYNQSRYPDTALDFMRFLTTRDNNEEYARIAGWLPVVIGAEPIAELTPFIPDQDGFSPGFVPYIGGNFHDVHALLENNYHVLLRPDGSVDAFVDAVRPHFEDVLVRAMVTRLDNTALVPLRRQDAVFGARFWLSEIAGFDDPFLTNKTELMHDTQTENETHYLWADYNLKRHHDVGESSIAQ